MDHKDYVIHTEISEVFLFCHWVQCSIFHSQTLFFSFSVQVWINAAKPTNTACKRLWHSKVYRINLYICHKFSTSHTEWWCARWFIFSSNKDLKVVCPWNSRTLQHKEMMLSVLPVPDLLLHISMLTQSCTQKWVTVRSSHVGAKLVVWL